MNSNIHEAPAFVQLCAELGIELIDFRHLVGNVYFSEHEEMLNNNKEKYNYYRELIIEESIKYNINVRLPEPFKTTSPFICESMPKVNLSDFKNISPDTQSEEVINMGDFIPGSVTDLIYAFLSSADCLRPFNENYDHCK